MCYHSGFVYNSSAFPPAGIINETEIMRTLIGSEGSGCISHDNSLAEALCAAPSRVPSVPSTPGAPPTPHTIVSITVLFRSSPGVHNHLKHKQ